MAFFVYHFVPHGDIISALRLFEQHSKWKDDNEKTMMLRFGISNHDETKVLPSMHITSLFARIFRKHCSTKAFGNSVFGLEQQLLALQLIMAQRNKKLTGEFTVPMEEVIEAHEEIAKSKLNFNSDLNGENVDLKQDYKDFLCNCNAVDYADVVQRVKSCFNADESVRELYQTGFQYIIAGVPDTLVEAEMLKLLIGKKQIICASTTDGEENFVMRPVEELLRGKSQFSQDNSGTLSSPPRQSTLDSPFPGVVEKSQILQVMLAYLKLLVNSRDELALSQAINIPCRDLGRKEFTVLRKVARDKNMPMYQTAMSFILQLRLGGKSYAPPGDHPFYSFTKGLGEFVVYFQKLQNMLEEIPQPENAILKVINTVRLSLNRSKDRPFEVEMINHVFQTLQRQLKHIVGRKHDFDAHEKRNCKMVGASTILLIQRLLDENLCQANLRDNNVQELYSVLSTPETAQGRSKHHSLLTQFRTPEITTPEVSTVSRIEKSPRKQNRKIDKTKMMCGDMSWAKPAVSVGFTPGKHSPMSNANTVANILMIPPSPNRDYCKEICSETPKSRARKRPRESAYDKENIPQRGNVDCAYSVKAAAVQNSPVKPPAKRLMLNKDKATSKSKKNSKGSNSGRQKKKQAVLSQGQKQMTHFFRV